MGRWRSQEFLPMCTEIRKRGHVEFCGLVANYRIFKSKPKEYITFVTLGTGNGRYLDVVLPRAVDFHEHKLLWGQGAKCKKDNSEYVRVANYKRLRLEQVKDIS
mgnify:FL=1